MGSQPLPVRGIAGKASSDLVIDAAPGHLLQGLLRHAPGLFFPGEGGVAQQEQQVLGRGELGGCAEAAELLVEDPLQLLIGPPGQLRVDLPGLQGPLPAQEGAELPGGLLEALPVPLPLALHRLEQRDQAKLPPPVLPGQIGPGEEGLPLRGEQQGQGPAAAAVEGHAGLHIHRVHVRPLLPVHLHRHEAPVQDPGHLRALKGLPGHHMAPVAGGVANGEEDGFSLPAGLFKGFLPPGVPVYGVLCVLQQVGRALVLQTVRHGDSPLQAKAYGL